MALKVGELYALLKLESQQFEAGLKRGEQQMQTFERRVDTLIQRSQEFEKATRRVGIALAGLVGSLTVATNRAIQYANDIETLHLQTGIAIRTIEGLGYAAQQSNADMQTLGIGLRSFARRAAEAAYGNEQFLTSFEHLGISQRMVQENLHDLEGLLMMVADGIAQLPTEAEAASVMMGLMSDAGRRLVPMFRQGADGIRGFTTELERMGAATDEGAIRALSKLGSDIDATRATLAAMSRQIVVDFLPAIQEVRERIDRLARAFLSLDEEQRRQIVRWAGITGAVMAGTTAFGMLVGVLGRVGRALILLGNLARRHPLVLLAVAATGLALSFEEVRVKLNELARSLGLGPILDEFEDLLNAFGQMAEFELQEPDFERIADMFRFGLEDVGDVAEEAAEEVVDRVAEVLGRLAEEEFRIMRGTRVLAQARREMEPEEQILEEWLRAQERALIDLIMLGLGPADEAYQRLYESIGKTAQSLRELRAHLDAQEEAAEQARRAAEATEQFYNELVRVADVLVRDLFTESGALAYAEATARALGNTWGEVESLDEQIRSLMAALHEYQRLGLTVTETEVQSVLDMLRELSAELDEARFARRMDELRRRAREAVDTFGPGGVAEWLSEWRGETTLPLEFWLDPDAAQKAMRPSRVMLETQLRELDQVIDEMVRTIQDRAGRVSVFDIWGDEDVRAALMERMRLRRELAAVMWEEEVERLNQRLAQSLAETDVQRLIAAVTGDAFDEAEYQWRAVERAIWDVVRAGQAHGRSTEEIMRMVDELVGQYGHLAAAAQEAADPIAEIRRQLESELTTGIAIQRLIEPAFDQLGFEIQALTRAIAQAANELEGADFGAIFDAMQPEIQRLQELQRLQQRQLAVQDAVNSALDGFAQELANSNRVVQDFMRLLRWEQGGLRFDMGGLWSLGANLIAQFISALFAGPQAQLPDPRRFEAPDPYMYGLAVAREQWGELEAELERLQKRLAAERERLAREESSLWNRLFRQDILNYWRDRIRLTEQEIASLESALGAFDMQSFLGIDAGSIAQAVESGFDMADISRLGQSLEDVIRTALVRAWVTSEEMVRLQTQFRDLLQQVVDEFVQHGELRADALDPLRAVIAAIQERGEALQEVLRQLGLTSEELNEQFSRMVYNLPYGYRVERAIFEASPPRIPALAAGGIVTRPTLALVGESGPEAVVPLDGRGFGTVNITIERMEVQDGRDFGRRLDEELRRRGLVRAGNVTAWGGRR